MTVFLKPKKSFILRSTPFATSVKYIRYIFCDIMLWRIFLQTWSFVLGSSGPETGPMVDGRSTPGRRGMRRTHHPVFGHPQCQAEPEFRHHRQVLGFRASRTSMLLLAKCLGFVWFRLSRLGLSRLGKVRWC